MIKKAVLLAVLLALFGLGTAFAAPPVSVDSGGLGDALIYGYYNVRDNEQYFAVTNTATNDGARIRVRFREAATLVDDGAGNGICNGSQDLLDFDICLSPADMWSALIATGPNGNAKIYSADTDTYVQTVSGGTPKIVIFPTEYPSGVDFKYGSSNPISSITADMTREGYFEIIAENLLSKNCTTDATKVTVEKPLCTCGKLYDTTDDVGNVLMGHTIMVNPVSTAAYGYVATALANFASGDISADLGPRPNFKDDGAGLTAVNYALTKNMISTVYDLEADFGSKTALIVTFPTKALTHGEVYDSTKKTCTADTDDIFDDMNVKITIWDDKENSPESVCEFSPCLPGTPNKLPYEVNVVDINSGGLLTSDVKTAITTTFDFGWISIDLVDAVPVGHPTPQHYSCAYGNCSDGLPAVGYVLLNFLNSKETAMMPMNYSTKVYVD